MLQVQTNLEVNMTVRITSRDQVTGEDQLKLNALFKAVEDLGGVIDYPPATNTDNGNSGSSTFDTLVNATQVGQTIQYTGGLFPETTDWANSSGFLGIKKLTALKDFIFEVPALTGSQELIIVANSAGIPNQEPGIAMFNVCVVGQGQLGGGFTVGEDDFAEYSVNQGDIIKIHRNGKHLEFTINDSQTYQTAENPNIDSDAWLHVVMRNSSANVASLTVIAEAQG